MPLRKGSSPKTVKENFREFRHGDTFARTMHKFGKETADKQMIAAVLNAKRESKGRMFGGVAPQVPDFSAGSMGMPGSPPPSVGIAGNPVLLNPYMGAAARRSGGALGYYPDRDVHDGKITKGPLLSTVPGRTDAHFTHVPSGSYVIPADIVSGRGEGNTLAGARALNKLFGINANGKPHLQNGIQSRHAGGGKGGSDQTGKPVRVNLAGGEIVVPPENLLETLHRLNPGKKFTLKEIHAIMDKWVLAERKKLRKTLAKLPGPVRE